MTNISSEISHKLVSAESPLIMKTDSTPDEIDSPEITAEALQAELLRQLGRTSMDNLSLVVQAENSPNQQLEDDAKALLVGQDHAIESVISALDRSVLRNPKRPICSLLFLGQTGVGKTELCRILNTLLHDGDEKYYTRIDCSNFQNKGQSTALIGASPAYIGFDQDPKLSQNKIRGKKHILVFDEIEKAHPEVFALLLQILEEGELKMQNSEMTTHFKECIIILTSNLGARELSKALENKSFGFTAKGDAQSGPSAERLQNIVNSAVKDVLPPELLSRVDQRVIFNSLDDEQLGEVVQRANDKQNEVLYPQGYRLHLTDSLVAALVKSDDERMTYGGRRITKTFENTISTRLGRLILSGSIPVGSDVYVALDTGGNTGKDTSSTGFAFNFFSAPNEELLAEYKRLLPFKRALEPLPASADAVETTDLSSIPTTVSTITPETPTAYSEELLFPMS